MKADLVEHRDYRETSSPILRGAPPARLHAFLERWATLRTGLIAIFDQAVVSGASFGTTVIIGRFCSPDQLGLYFLTISLVYILLGIQDQVVASPYTVFCNRREGRELAEYTGSTWVHHLVLTGISVFVLLAMTVAVWAVGSLPMVGSGLLALVGGAPLLLLREGIRRFAFARLQLTTAVAIDAAVAVIQLGSLLLLSRLELLSIFTIYAVMGIACAVACLGWFVFQPPSVRFVRRRLLPDWNCNWSFAKWALPGFLVGETTPFIMPWILSLGVGMASTGVFGACNTLVCITNILLVGISNFLMPKAAHAFSVGGVDELRRVLAAVTWTLVLILGTFCVALFLTDDWLVVLVYGKRYSGCGMILLTLGLRTIAIGLVMTTNNGLWVLAKLRSNFVANVCNLAITLVAAACLVVPFGALGAALASLAGTSTGALVRMLALRQAMDSFRVEGHGRHLEVRDG